jgi:putative transposase
VGTFDEATIELQAQICKLERRVKVLTAVMVLLLALVRVARLSLTNTRVPDPGDKARVLRAIDRSEGVLPKRIALRIIGLSSSRFGQWSRHEDLDCPLDDLSQCPRAQPGQLTPEEVREMREMATAPEYRHVPTSTLAMLAQRLGKVFASASTWCRYVRQRCWRRPRRRVHPRKPTTGVRATAPNGLWHVDTSVLRLLDGSRVYLRAVIDNFSRRILAWSLTSKLEPLANAPLLVKAMEAKTAASDGAEPQSLMVDGGVENFNVAGDELVNQGLLERILAQTDVRESNSLIERFWLQAKHGWLFLHDLEGIATVSRLVEFYVTGYNSALPHSAHAGRTPDEVYFGKAVDVPDKLAAARTEAREARLTARVARLF